jgi:hypothetical protein
LKARMGNVNDEHLLLVIHYRCCETQSKTLLGNSRALSKFSTLFINRLSN